MVAWAVRCVRGPAVQRDPGPGACEQTAERALLLLLFRYHKAQSITPCRYNLNTRPVAGIARGHNHSAMFASPPPPFRSSLLSLPTRRRSRFQGNNSIINTYSVHSARWEIGALATTAALVEGPSGRTSTNNSTIPDSSPAQTNQESGESDA